MPDKIKIGDYIRTESQGIKKVTRIEWDIDTKENYYYFDDLFGEWEHRITKNSKNIIDLIEVGDYVNGKLIHKTDIRKDSAYVYYGNCKTFTDYQIKSIVTKEQFEQMKYKVKED